MSAIGPQCIRGGDLRFYAVAPAQVDFDSVRNLRRWPDAQYRHLERRARLPLLHPFPLRDPRQIAEAMTYCDFALRLGGNIGPDIRHMLVSRLPPLIGSVGTPQQPRRRDKLCANRGVRWTLKIESQSSPVPGEWAAVARSPSASPVKVRSLSFPISMRMVDKGPFGGSRWQAEPPAFVVQMCASNAISTPCWNSQTKASAVYTYWSTMPRRRSARGSR